MLQPVVTMSEEYSLFSMKKNRISFNTSYQKIQTKMHFLALLLEWLQKTGEGNTGFQILHFLLQNTLSLWRVFYFFFFVYSYVSF